jgi:hypothetical protein
VEIPDYRRLDGVEVTNQDGEKLGRVDGLFVDDQVNVPTGSRPAAGANTCTSARSTGSEPRRESR